MNRVLLAARCLATGVEESWGLGGVCGWLGVGGVGVWGCGWGGGGCLGFVDPPGWDLTFSYLLVFFVSFFSK